MKLHAPEGVCSFSHDGETYEVKKGTVDVPDHAVDVALLHGFTVAAAKGKKAAEAAADEHQEQTAEQAAEQPAADAQE